MSVNASTAPVPFAVSIGVAVYATGNIDPSRRTNQSSPLFTPPPSSTERSSLHSSAGYGDPSRRVWWIVSWL